MQDLVRVDVPPIPSPLPRENEPSIPHFSLPSLPRSGPQQLSAASSWPWSSFYLLSTLPAQEGGEEPGWSGDCSRPPPPASRGQQQGRHCSRRCHVASGCCCHSPAQAVLGQSGAWCRGDAGG